MINIKNLTVTINGNTILDDITMDFENGVNVVLGPNGSGKSTLLATIAGRHDCQIESGSIIFRGEDIAHKEPEYRAKMGVFLGFQSPYEIPGMPNAMFIAEAVKSKFQKLAQAVEESAVHGEETRPNSSGGSGNDNKISKTKILDKISRFVDENNMPKTLLTSKGVNTGFSGGEKKYNELLQMAMLEPELAMLDEIDSGLDVDGNKVAIRIIEDIIASKGRSAIVVTHYHDFAEKLSPKKVFVIIDKKLAISAGAEIIKEVKQNGFRKFR